MKYFFILFSFLLSIHAFSQKNEYQYFSLRFGYSQGFSTQPGYNENKYLKTPDGEMQLKPVDSYLGYTPGFVANLFYHFDFPTDNAGIMAGVEYNNYGVASKYETVNGKYSVVERNKINAIGIPLAFKIGPKFYDKQTYGYLGAQFNYHLSMNVNQKVSWLQTSSSAKLTPDEFAKTATVFFVGFNWMVLNIQFDYIPGTFFNKEYIMPETNITPYSAQTDNMFFLKVSFHTPTNDWLPSKSFKLKRFFRKIKFW